MFSVLHNLIFAVLVL